MVICLELGLFSFVASTTQCCYVAWVLQNYIRTLEASLQEEMSRHAPLYGAGLEALSQSELETLARIHNEGLRSVRTLQQHRGGGSMELLPVNMDTIVSHSPIQPHIALFGAPPPIAVGMPMTNGVSVHGNGHLNGTGVPWYPPS